MAPVAYFLCWALIVVLMVRDSSRRIGISAASWIPTLMVFTLFSRTPGEWLRISVVREGLGNEVSGSSLDQGFFACVILCALIISFARRVKWGRLLAANMALTCFYCYFLISPLWASYPLGSFIRIVKDFGATIIVISVILSEKKPLEAMRAVYARCACVLIPLSALFTRFTDYGRGYAKNGTLEYTGAATQKNSFGEMLLVLIIFLIWDHLEELGPGAKRVWRRMPWDRVLLLLTGLWLLTISQSRTSLVSLMLGLVLILRRGQLASLKISKTVFVIALVLPILLLCTQEFKAVFTPILLLLGRDATFTGRADIWQHITFTTVNPLIGAGFWNFWGGPGGDAIRAAMQTEVPNAHDGYLDMYLDGGLIGLFLLSCVLIAAGRRLLKNLSVHRYYRLAFAFVIIVIIHNITETSFARLSPLWFTLLLMIVDFPSLRAKLNSSQISVGGTTKSDESKPEFDFALTGQTL